MVIRRLVEYLIIRWPLVLSITFAFICIGITAYTQLPMEAFPDVANMQVRVITQVPGKAPEEVERLVTVPIEKELNGIPNSYPPRSISIFGLSVITVVFADGTDPYRARQQVLEGISHCDIPEDLHPELDPNASPVGEIFRYSLEGKHWSPQARKEVQDWLLNRLFKSIDGIVDSTGFGGPTKIYLVEIDPGRLQALGVTQDQVATALSLSNDSTGGSYITSNDQRYMVRGIGLLRSVEDINDVVITSNEDGTPIRIKDIAKVSINAAVRKGQVGVNNDDDAVEGILMMQRGDNPSRVIKLLSESIADIKNYLPPGMSLVPLYDRSVLVKRTVNTISHNVIDGVALVILLLLIFLFQARASIICALVIPLALLSAFTLFTIFKIPVNLLSLGAIDFGIIVDGAIIMVESIIAKLNELKPGNSNLSELRSAILKGTTEVARPILFSTTIIIFTFLPILCMQHVEGRLFRPLAIMMNFNLFGAAISTLLLVPVLCYIVYKRKPPVHRESPILAKISAFYEESLEKYMRISKKVVLSGFAFVLICAMLVPQLGCEFIPELEEGNIWLTVTVLPASVTLEKSVEIARNIRRIIKAYPEVKTVLTQIGSPDDGTDPNPYCLIEVLVDLKPQEEWNGKFKTKEKLVESMDKAIDREMPGLICNFSQCIKDSMEEAMSGVKNGEFAIKIYGNDLKTLEKLAEEVSKSIKNVPGIVDVAHDLILGQPQVVVQIDQLSASRFGIRTNDILNIIETSIGGKIVTALVEGERHFDVVLRYEKSYRDQPEDIGEILVPTPAGQRIPLKQLATIKIVEGANSIFRDNNRRRIAVYANIRGRDLGSAVLDSQRQVKKNVKLPESYSIEYAGEFKRALEAASRLSITVPITLVAIFLLLYFLFDSAIYALLAMSTLPLTIGVSILVLFFTGTHLSISSGVGFIALFGLSIQNGVIILSKIKELIESGIPYKEAILSGSITKMRPVIIAILVAAVGLAPAAIATGIGSQSQRPFAIVISYSIIPATLLALYFLPCIASLFLKDKNESES